MVETNPPSSNQPTLMRASDLIGLPVVSIFSGEDVAEVRDVVYDSASHRLLGFTLNKRGFFAGRMHDVLPSESVAAIGADAVMIQNEAAITDTGTSPAPDQLGEAKFVLGNLVISAKGDHLGKIVGVILSTGGAPAAVGYEVDRGDGDTVFVPISEQLALSNDNLLLPADATAFIRNDLAGFGAAVADYRVATLPSSTKSPKQTQQSQPTSGETN